MTGKSEMHSASQQARASGQPWCCTLESKVRGQQAKNRLKTQAQLLTLQSGENAFIREPLSLLLGPSAGGKGPTYTMEGNLKVYLGKC